MPNVARGSAAVRDISALCPDGNIRATSRSIATRSCARLPSRSVRGTQESAASPDATHMRDDHGAARPMLRNIGGIAYPNCVRPRIEARHHVGLPMTLVARIDLDSSLPALRGEIGAHLTLHGAARADGLLRLRCCRDRDHDRRSQRRSGQHHRHLPHLSPNPQFARHGRRFHPLRQPAPPHMS